MVAGAAVHDHSPPPALNASAAGNRTPGAALVQLRSCHGIWNPLTGSSRQHGKPSSLATASSSLCDEDVTTEYGVRQLISSRLGDTTPSARLSASHANDTAGAAWMTPPVSSAVSATDTR